jgi:hypothetical protein
MPLFVLCHVYAKHWLKVIWPSPILFSLIPISKLKWHIFHINWGHSDRGGNTWRPHVVAQQLAVKPYEKRPLITVRVTLPFESQGLSALPFGTQWCSDVHNTDYAQHQIATINWRLTIWFPTNFSPLANSQKSLNHKSHVWFCVWQSSVLRSSEVVDGKNLEFMHFLLVLKL